MAKIKEINSNSEFEEIINSESSIIKFSAEWCNPCKMLGKMISEMDESKLGNTLVGEINCDSDSDEVQDIVIKYQIRNLPSLIYFKNGVMVGRSTGSLSETQFINKMTEYLNNDNC